MTIGVILLALLCCLGPLLLVGGGLGATTLLIALLRQKIYLVALGIFGVTAVILIALPMRANARAEAQNFPVRMLGEVVGAIRLAFRPPNRVRSLSILIGIGTLVTAFYLIFLPAEYFGAISFAALQFLTPWLAIVAVGLGFGFALALTLNVTAFAAKAGTNALSLGGLLSSLLPTSLCCTSFVPTVLATLGASIATIFATSGAIQRFFAAYSTEIFLFALGLVAISIILSARQLSRACALPNALQR